MTKVWNLVNGSMAAYLPEGAMNINPRCCKADESRWDISAFSLNFNRSRSPSAAVPMEDIKSTMVFTIVIALLVMYPA